MGLKDMARNNKVSYQETGKSLQAMPLRIQSDAKESKPPIGPLFDKIMRNRAADK